MPEIFLGLGSNQKPRQHLAAALDALAGFWPDLRCSPVFESEPVGHQGANFYNLVVCAQTDWSLPELSQRLKAIEAEHGRYAQKSKGLPLDIDVLLYGNTIGKQYGCVLPRAEILQNAFVLWPLALLVPDYLHPQQGKTFAVLWQEMEKTQVLWPVAFHWRGQSLTPPALLAGKTL